MLISLKRDFPVYYVPDPQGNTRDLVYVYNGTPADDHYIFMAFGNELGPVGPSNNPYRYNGQWGYYRDILNRMYVQARHLDATKGRWLSEDPIGLDGGDGNVFRYVMNGPVGTTDPAGLQVIITVPPPPLPPPAPNCSKLGLNFPKGPYRKLPPTKKNCQGYLKLCNQGFVYGCNAYWACLYLAKLAILPDSPGSQCARGCLQKTIPFAQIPNTDCGRLYCQHEYCFARCGWSPSTPFDWPFFNDQCCETSPEMFQPVPPANKPCKYQAPCPMGNGVQA